MTSRYRRVFRAHHTDVDLGRVLHDAETEGKQEVHIKQGNTTRFFVTDKRWNELEAHASDGVGRLESISHNRHRNGWRQVLGSSTAVTQAVLDELRWLKRQMVTVQIQAVSGTGHMHLNVWSFRTTRAQVNYARILADAEGLGAEHVQVKTGADKPRYFVTDKRWLQLCEYGGSGAGKVGCLVFVEANEPLPGWREIKADPTDPGIALAALREILNNRPEVEVIAYD